MKRMKNPDDATSSRILKKAIQDPTNQIDAPNLKLAMLYADLDYLHHFWNEAAISLSNDPLVSTVVS